MHIKHLPCMCQSVPSSQAKRSLREETFIYNKRVTFYDIFVLWIFILEFRPVVTWYIFASNFLAMFVIRPSRYPEKHFNSFLLLYIGFYYAWKWLWKISIYTKAFLTKIHIRMHVCTKSFSSAHFPTFTLHQTKAWKLSTFYAYIECTSMHRMEICAEKLFRILEQRILSFLRQHNIPRRNIEIGLCKLFSTAR